MCTLETSALGPGPGKAEPRPRIIKEMSSQMDRSLAGSYGGTQSRNFSKSKSSLSVGADRPYTKLSGNAKPQEPEHHKTWALSKRKGPTKVQHPHPQSWSFSGAPGKCQPSTAVNPFHRVWLTDVGPRGRWNRERKNDFYRKQDNLLDSLQPHDEIHSKGYGNYKQWTHLNDQGTKPGGQNEKLDYKNRGPGTASTHFYTGKYENVKHVQRIVKTGARDPVTKKPAEFLVDDRPQFDSRLLDDMIRRNYEEQQWALESCWDVHRPANTASCPQLGADWMQG
jgi:hypothetical protein